MNRRKMNRILKGKLMMLRMKRRKMRMRRKKRESRNKRKKMRRKKIQYSFVHQIILEFFQCFLNAFLVNVKGLK